ncbi:MAG: Ig-like domain-containing protein [Candidatus Manganitrophus sp.]|nr:MAG: Ig-like domain-containing protein [Candidatus Manganitrophus sp.]
MRKEWLALWIVLWGYSVAGAIEVESPAEGSIVHSGEVVNIRIVPSPGEQIGGVVMVLGEPDTASPYDFQYEVKPDDIGDLTLSFMALKPSGQFSSKIQLHLIGIIPPSVTLQSLRAEPEEVIFRKLPAGSNPNQVHDSETERIAVMGTFSDGAEREISLLPGTTYQSSDIKIATVDSKGLVTAIGPGKAFITIKYGDKKLQIPVFVRVKQ